MNTEKRSVMWSGVFSRSRLPRGLIVLVLTLIFTHFMFLLLAQPSAYWLDPRAFSTEWFSPPILAKGPTHFALLVLAYLAVNGLLLAVLPPTPARILVGGLFVFHFFQTGNLLFSGIWPLFSPQTKPISELAQAGFLLLILGPLSMISWRLAGAPRPSQRWIPRAGSILAACWALLLILCLRQAILSVRRPDSTSWRPLVTGHIPSPRSGAGITYDTQRQRAVLFGGQVKNEEGRVYFSSETWEWDGQDWVNIPDVGPPGRSHPAMAYDPSRGVVVLYGGLNESGPMNDVWEWDGKNWQKKCPSCNPAARWGANFLFDENQKKLVLYGGLGEKNAWFTESWSWNGIGWTYNDIASSTPATFNPAIAYETGQQRALVFVDDPLGGTWIWQNNAFIHLKLSIKPPSMTSSSLVYDPQHQRSVLYGGIDTRKIIYYNQTWVFERDTWRRQNTPLAPPPREGMAGFYDPTRHSMLVFGGKYLDRFYGDLWELSLIP